MDNDMLVFLTGAGIFIVFFLIAFSNYRGMKRKERDCIAVTYARVLELQRETEWDDDREYHRWYPLLAYYINGEYIESVYRGCKGSRFEFNEGDEVEVLYNPSNYDDYYVKGHQKSNVVNLVIMALSIVAALVFITKFLAKLY